MPTSRLSMTLKTAFLLRVCFRPHYNTSGKLTLTRAFSITTNTMGRVSARPDPSTLSNYTEWLTEHTITNFNINFDEKRLEGSVTHRLKRVAGANKVILDANHLDIHGVKVNGTENKTFEVASPKAPHGGWENKITASSLFQLILYHNHNFYKIYPLLQKLSLLRIYPLFYKSIPLLFYKSIPLPLLQK